MNRKKAPKKKLKVLVVDDSRAMRTYVGGALKNRFDCALTEAKSGFEALRYLPREAFDLVITDINMPDINGHELIRLIRRSGRFAEVAILIISTQASDRDRERVLTLGANSFLAKPFSPNDLVDEVDQLFPDEEQAGS